MIPKELIPNTNATPDGGSISFLAIWRAIRRSRLLVLAIAAGAVLVAGLLTVKQRKIYRSSSMLVIDPAPSRPLGADVATVVDAAGSYWNNREYYETELRVISSSSVLQEVVRRLNLDHDSAFLENLPVSTSPKQANVPLDLAAAILVVVSRWSR